MSSCFDFSQGWRLEVYLEVEDEVNPSFPRLLLFMVLNHSKRNNNDCDWTPCLMFFFNACTIIFICRYNVVHCMCAVCNAQTRLVSIPVTSNIWRKVPYILKCAH